MWFLSTIGNVPTPNVCSDVWDCVESYAIRMLLAHRLKIIPTSNLKLIISFLVLLTLVLSFFKLLSIVALAQHTHLTSHTVLRLANRPSAQFWNSSKQGQTPSDGDLIYLFSSQGRVLVLRVSCHGTYLEPRWRRFFSATPCSMQESRKFLPMVYLWGPNFNSSPAKLCVLLSRNLSFLLCHYYKVYIQWVLRSQFKMVLSPKNARDSAYVSHRLSPACPLRMMSKNKSPRWETSKSRLCLRRTPPSTFPCDMIMGPRKLFWCMWWQYWMPSKMWSLQGLQEGLEGLYGAQASGEVNKG